MYVLDCTGCSSTGRCLALTPSLVLQMILIAFPNKPLEHTPKGTPRRGVCLKLYAAEIDGLYAAEEVAAYAGNRLFLDRV